MRGAGPFLGERAYLLLRGSAMLRPQWGAEVCLFRALREWNATQDTHGKQVVVDIGLLAAVLAQSLEDEGFGLSGLVGGETLAFDCCEIEALVCKIVILETEDREHWSGVLRQEQQRKIDMGTYVNIDKGDPVNPDSDSANVINIGRDLSESAVNGRGQGQ